MHPEADYHYYLLTKEPVPYSFVQQVEQKQDCFFTPVMETEKRRFSLCKMKGKGKTAWLKKTNLSF